MSSGIRPNNKNGPESILEDLHITVTAVSRLQGASLPSPSHLRCAPDRPHLELVLNQLQQLPFSNQHSYIYVADCERLVAGVSRGLCQPCWYMLCFCLRLDWLILLSLMLGLKEGFVWNLLHQSPSYQTLTHNQSPLILPANFIRTLLSDFNWRK